MSGLFTTMFNPGLSVSDGSDESAATAAEGSEPVGDTATNEPSREGSESGGTSSQSLDGGADLDLGLEVTLSNEVSMTWADDEGNVHSYSQSDELTLDVDVEESLDTLLTNDSAYTDSVDYTA